MSETGKHQGVIAVSAAYEYAEVSDILENAERKGEPPFIIILDGIEDPHNLGAIIHYPNQGGVHMASSYQKGVQWDLPLQWQRRLQVR